MEVRGDYALGSPCPLNLSKGRSLLPDWIIQELSELQ